MLFFFRRRCRRRVHARRKLAEGDAILHRGGSHALHVAHDRDRPQGCEIHGAFFEVNLDDTPTSKKDWQEEVRLEILLWHKKQARLVFRQRTDDWAQQLKVKYRRLIPSNPRRQWGSCSARNDIRLNWRLIMAAPELLDYVIVHELCHVTHKNHSKRFWNLVATMIPDWKARRLQLRALDPAADL